MAVEWRNVSIEDIASKIAMGPFGSDIKTDNFVHAGVPVIRGGNLTSGRFHGAGFVFLTEEKADELANANAFPGDLVFTHRGTLGQIGLVPAAPFKRYVVSQSQMKLRCDPKSADPTFIYYFFRSPAGQHALLMNTSQTGVPAISRPTTSLKSIRLPLPPLPEQRAIAHILGTLDDKIELNRRMNETLEAIARALFKSWFVDFDPVRAKAKGPAGQDDQVSAMRQGGRVFWPTDPGLPKPLADLFTDFFEDSELGEIPNGWKVGSVDDEFDLTMGQSPPGETYNEAGVGLPFYQGCTDFGFRFPTRRIYCTAPTRLGKAGDTLVSVRAPVGDINMATEHCAIGRGVAAVRHKTGSRSYSYQFMKSIKEVFARFEAEGTVFGSIGKKDFHAIACVNPPRELVLAYEARVSPLDDRVEVNERESRTLAALRDTLLPKLISGELRVDDAERFVREATA